MSAALVLGCLFAAPQAASGQSVQLTRLAGTEVFAAPYYVTSPPGDGRRIFVVGGAGSISVVKDGTRLPTPFVSITGDVLFDPGNETGMMSMAFAPDYATSGLFYVFYTRQDAGGAGTPGHDLIVEEFRRSAANPDVADPSSRRLVMRIPHLENGQHNGGQIQFGPDGLLYISTGDQQNEVLSQDRTSPLGKILRIDPRGAAPLQYSIPAGNPYADGAGGNADEVYATGLRNPYRFSFDRSTGDIAIGDVGEEQREEVDYRAEGTAAGANFGWPCFEGTLTLVTTGPCSPALTDHSPPPFEYAHPGMGGVSVIGGYVVRDPSLPGLAGRYLYADLFHTAAGNPKPDIRTVQLGPSSATGDAGLGVNAPFLVSFGQDACGHIYAARQNGFVFRVDPASGPVLCKLAPAVTVDAAPSASVKSTGALAGTVTCDEDCSATVSGSLKVTTPSTTTRFKPKTKKCRKKAKKKCKKPKAKTVVKPGETFTLQAQPAGVRLQLGTPTPVSLPLSAADRARLSAAVASGATATATVSVSATGGGGGTATDSGSVALP